MFVWWSDPYAGITIAFVLLTAALFAKAAGLRFGRGAKFGRSGKIMLVVWTLVAAPWACITPNVVRSFGTERHDAAPNIKLPLADGRIAQLQDLRGKVVLLDFWATWCAPCRASGPALADLAGRYGSNHVAVVGISADEDEGAWRGYVGLHNVRRWEARDAGGEAADRFSVNGRPTFVLLDREGRVRWKQTGWTPFRYLVLRYRVGKLVTEPG